MPYSPLIDKFCLAAESTNESLKLFLRSIAFLAADSVSGSVEYTLPVSNPTTEPVPLGLRTISNSSNTGGSANSNVDSGMGASSTGAVGCISLGATKVVVVA